MRVSPCGWAFNIHDVKRESILSAQCSHSHPEGLIGAMVIGDIICFLKKNTWYNYGNDIVKDMVDHIWSDYYRHDWLPKAGQWDETCMGCVPLAIHHFIHSESFEDAIRKAVSYGGDSDTMGAIVGSLAEPYYGIPEWMKEKALSYLPQDMIDVVSRFRDRFVNKYEINYK